MTCQRIMELAKSLLPKSRFEHAVRVADKLYGRTQDVAMLHEVLALSPGVNEVMLGMAIGRLELESLRLLKAGGPASRHESLVTNAGRIIASRDKDAIAVRIADCYDVIEQGRAHTGHREALAILLPVACEMGIRVDR